MADDINKTISIDIEVNPDGLQQITQYQESFDNLKTSISNLGKPLTDLGTSISAISSGMNDAQTSANKLTAGLQKVGEAGKQAGSAAGQGLAAGTGAGVAKAKHGLAKFFGYFVQIEAAKSNVAIANATKTSTVIGQQAIDSSTTTNKTIAKNTVDSNAQTSAAVEKGATILQQAIGTKILSSTQEISDSAYKITTDFIQMQSQAKLKALQDDEAKALSVANLSANQKAAIQQKYQKLINNEQKKAFKEKQDADIAQAVINGAVAITKVTAQSGVAAPFMIGAVIAETAAQVAKIAAQKPPALAKGGYFMSDGKGAVLPGYSRNDNTNAYLRSGEAVVVSEAMRDPWARNLVSAINVAFGGRDFSVPNTSRGYAVGGIFTDGGNANRYYNQPMNDQKNLANTVAYQMINNFPPVYVDVKDINNQQNILAQTVNRVNL
jgi:hypothetical protein